MGLLWPVPKQQEHLLFNWTACDFEVSWGLGGQLNGRPLDFAACEKCQCFQRCMFGTTLGLIAPSVLNLPHVCAQACRCKLQPPKTHCGDGERISHEIDWYGTIFKVDEECDDGNTRVGDGCSQCKIENFMAELAQAQRVDQLGSTLCGGTHTLSECEAECLADPTCKSIWFGGGFCHSFRQILPLIPSQPLRGRGSDLFASSWDEMEYGCGEGRFVPAKEQPGHQIRASVVLFGIQNFDNQTHGPAFREVFEGQWFCGATCSLNLLSVGRGKLPFGTARREDRRADVYVVTVSFRMIVANTTSGLVLQQVAEFVNRGDSGLWGQLKTPSAGLKFEKTLFQDLLGTMWSSNGGYPRLALLPAPPPQPGTLFVKVPFQCTAARDASPPHADLCCGNLSQVFHTSM